VRPARQAWTWPDISTRKFLPRNPPKVRNFLLQTSLLEEFDADLCEAVLGKGDWKNLIKTVRQNNLFVLQVGPDGSWLRYHHIFQEFLQQRIREEEPEKAQTILCAWQMFMKSVTNGKKRIPSTGS
jgi:ATP/maltotriose-dependent transcriptional regulator MalT